MRSVLTALFAIATACTPVARGSAAKSSAPKPVATGPSADERGDWSVADFDGDGRDDRVTTEFTGGAHCCYRLTIELASGAKHELPFELDGGYVFGLDTTFPERFNAADFTGDGHPDLCMQIATDDAVEEAVPREWIDRWHLRSRYVVVYFADGELEVRSRTSDCAAEGDTAPTAG
jgi:hypothetical protein